MRRSGDEGVNAKPATFTGVKDTKALRRIHQFGHG